MNTRNKYLWGYAIFSVLYFLIAFLIFKPTQSQSKNVLITILYALGDILYWVNVIGIYFGLLILSSIAGMIAYRQQKVLFNMFRNIGIGTVVIAIVLFIVSNLS